jgi:hypothetical protein
LIIAGSSLLSVELSAALYGFVNEIRVFRLVS